MKITIDIDNQVIVKLVLTSIVVLCSDTQILLILFLVYNILSSYKLSLLRIKAEKDLMD